MLAEAGFGQILNVCIMTTHHIV